MERAEGRARPATALTGHRVAAGLSRCHRSGAAAGIRRRHLHTAGRAAPPSPWPSGRTPQMRRVAGPVLNCRTLKTETACRFSWEANGHRAVPTPLFRKPAGTAPSGPAGCGPPRPRKGRGPVQLLHGLVADLRRQVSRVFRHARQGSHQTRRRYREACDRAVPFLAAAFRLRKLANLSDKHLRAYVAHRQAAGIKPQTLRTDLAALRFLHSQLADVRHRLSSNAELGLGLPPRRYRGLGRNWADIECAEMIGRARALGQVRIALVLALCRHAGLRIHEAMRLDWAAARRGLDTGALQVKGKGGRIRDVPLGADAQEALREAFRRARPGAKLFVPPDVPTHRAIARVQSFVRRHRGAIARPGRHAPLTVHGLRHTYAAEQYRRRRESGSGQAAAERVVSQLLGHNRPEVTRIYLDDLARPTQGSGDPCSAASETTR